MTDIENCAKSAAGGGLTLIEKFNSPKYQFSESVVPQKDQELL